ncbi:MAG TPA: hypothetical protein VNU66_08310 [Mycobacteriales bacterium]|nr:hypothetical protein [Mycobacteriales bacterium]
MRRALVRTTVTALALTAALSGCAEREPVEEGTSTTEDTSVEDPGESGESGEAEVEGG